MDDTAQYRDPRLLPGPDVGLAMRDFIIAYALPALDPETVFAGYQNRAALPLGNDFAVYSAMRRVRHGTNVEEFVPGNNADLPDHVVMTAMHRAPVRVDLYSETDAAFHRASTLEVVSRSPAGVQFFRNRGLSVLYADPVKNSTRLMDGGQYVPRWSVTVHLLCQVRVAASIQGFDVVNMSRLEDVDVHHKPQK